MSTCFVGFRVARHVEKAEVNRLGEYPETSKKAANKNETRGELEYIIYIYI